MISPSGEDLWVLSPHCKDDLAADKQAFTSFCRYLNTKDETEHTIICLQIENDPCSIGSDRDFNSEGQAIFDSEVPTIYKSHEEGIGRMNDIWQKIGSKNSGTGFELFS